MGSLFGFGIQVLVAFVASLLVGRRSARQADGFDGVKKTVAVNVAATLGILLGYALARDSPQEVE